MSNFLNIHSCLFTKLKLLRKSFSVKRFCLLFLLMLSLFSYNCFAQTNEERLKLADDTYNHGDYFNAAVYYKQLLEKDNSNLDLAYKYANSCRLYNNYVDAENYFLIILKKDNNKAYPLAGFYYAEMNKYNGKYELALQSYKDFYELNKDKNDFYTQKTKQGISSTEYAIELMKDTTKVEITHLGKNINTPYSEFGALQLGDSALLFSSFRSVVSSDFESLLPDASLSQIYTSRISVAGYSNAKVLKGGINDPEINSANITIDSKNYKAYFTRCNQNDAGEMICEIYVSELKNSKWQKARRLNNNINSPGYTATQPCITYNNDKEVLYFTSNRPGGFGQLDLWYSIHSNGDYQQAVNLGSVINTPGNEITPFYDQNAGKLYFSSDWHKGLGGYDIFNSTGTLNQWTEPNNLGYPVNTSYNDLYYSVNEDSLEGYFTSNRPGSFFIKGETCCNDIFYYLYKPVIKNKEVKKDSLTISESVHLLLPITLYFHNDEPDPATLRTTTEKNYKQCLADYFDMKDKYKNEYSKGLKDIEKQKAIADIDTFFNAYVSNSFKDLEKFTALLLKDLQVGREVKITVKGYASPLNNEAYNINLTKRRIASLVNYLKEYNQGIFLPYLNANSPNGGKLIIYEEPLGKSQAAKNVSDNPNDLRNSVYSRAAALERKIQILYYDYTNPK